MKLIKIMIHNEQNKQKLSKNVLKKTIKIDENDEFKNRKRTFQVQNLEGSNCLNSILKFKLKTIIQSI